MAQERPLVEERRGEVPEDQIGHVSLCSKRKKKVLVSKAAEISLLLSELKVKWGPFMDGLELSEWNKGIDQTAGLGQLPVLEWLHANCSEGCTTQAMRGAAANGHLPVVEWLHANRTEG
eukprot:CAMPEP_0194710298 /NCGR_PEP_ID=MMETSP0296-20130528/2905_1 /TAXON_ID=39354 /ORGANISM="Heterosigma akashiwo, Strain CCMP2393" /LENGTH=118 /DNA_ID=CAMNT_0039607927 /DNA_START=126 /DNA_END=479 /DNA_ORIENTATION=-